MDTRYTVVAAAASGGGESGWYIMRDGEIAIVWYAAGLREMADRQCAIFNDPSWEPPASTRNWGKD